MWNDGMLAINRYKFIFFTGLWVVGVLLVGLSIYSAKKNNQVFMLKQQLTAKIELTGILAKQFNLDKSLIEVLRAINKLADASSIAIYFHDPESKSFVLGAMCQRAQEHRNLSPSYSGLSPYSKEMYIMPVSIQDEIIKNKLELFWQAETKLLVMLLREANAIILIGPIKKSDKKVQYLLKALNTDIQTVVLALLEEEKRNSHFQQATKLPSKEKLDVKTTGNAQYKRYKLNSLESFAVYYGFGKEEELQKFELVIVEPSAQTEEAISLLQQKGTLVIAYVSVMEISRDGIYSQLLHQQDLLRINNELADNVEYNTMLVDLQSKNWKTLLMNHISSLLADKQYDGVFLDTIADVELDIIPEKVREILLNEASKLVREIRNGFPNSIIIQNNGLGRLYSYTCQYINGICWENPPLNKLEDEKWLGEVAETFARLNKIGLKLFILLENKQSTKADIASDETVHIRMLRALAKKHDILLYSAPFHYLDL